MYNASKLYDHPWVNMYECLIWTQLHNISSSFGWLPTLWNRFESYPCTLNHTTDITHSHPNFAVRILRHKSYLRYGHLCRFNLLFYILHRQVLNNNFTYISWYQTIIAQDTLLNCSARTTPRTVMGQYRMNNDMKIDFGRRIVPISGISLYSLHSINGFLSAN